MHTATSTRHFSFAPLPRLPVSLVPAAMIHAPYMDEKDDIKVASSLNNVAGLLATTGSVEEALPLFARSHEIYVQQLGENHPHSVATQLWVQQLSAPAPPPARRRARNVPLPQGGGGGCGRQIGDGQHYQSRDLLARGPPPPLLEGGEDNEGSETSPGQQPVCF